MEGQARRGLAVGGIQDQIVDGQSGVLVRPDDLEGFAGAITELLSDPARAEWMGHHARERVRGAFLGARHLEQYVELFEGIAGGEGAYRERAPEGSASRPLR